VEFLVLQMNVKVDFCSAFGRTALHAAAQVHNMLFFLCFIDFFLKNLLKAGEEQIVRFLLRENADVDFQDEIGFTPLMLACTNLDVAQLAVAQLLVSNGILIIIFIYYYYYFFCEKAIFF
jgi:ankyrin repeat protein